MMFVVGVHYINTKLIFSVIVAICSIIGVFSLLSQSAGGDVLYASETEAMNSLVEQTNELRLELNLEPLIPSEELEESATAKLADMKVKNYWAHYGPDDTSFSAFIWDKKPEANKVGENLARCFSTYERAFIGLKNSPTHYEVMVSTEFKYIGVASVKLENGCESIAMHLSD